jgi:hypothetical protein
VREHSTDFTYNKVKDILKKAKKERDAYVAPSHLQAVQ